MWCIKPPPTGGREAHPAFLNLCSPFLNIGAACRLRHYQRTTPSSQPMSLRCATAGTTAPLIVLFVTNKSKNVYLWKVQDSNLRCFSTESAPLHGLSQCLTPSTTRPTSHYVYPDIHLFEKTANLTAGWLISINSYSLMTYCLTRQNTNNNLL